MKYIISIIFFISLSLYSQNIIVYSGDTLINREGKNIDIDSSDEIKNKDIIETKKNSYAEMKIGGKYIIFLKTLK